MGHDTASTRRVALVTGASAGLGAEFARQLAARGFDLVLIARRGDRLATLANELERAHGVRAVPIVADLADAAAPPSIVDRVRDLGLRVDYLINNAGADSPDLLDERDWPAHARYLELMMISIAHLCHLLAPAMRERGFGRIVNVASLAGMIVRGGDCQYGPAKAYVIALSEAMHRRLARDGVHVCALCPGFTHTEFHAGERMAAMKGRTPGFIWYGADVVVREGLAAVERGRSVLVSGRLYRWLAPLLRSPLLRGLVARFD